MMTSDKIIAQIPSRSIRRHGKTITAATLRNWINRGLFPKASKRVWNTPYWEVSAVREGISAARRNGLIW